MCSAPRRRLMCTYLCCGLPPSRPPSSYLRSVKENAVRSYQLFHPLRGGSTFSRRIAMSTIAFSGAGYHQNDFSHPGQPEFGHDACGAHLFTQPCNDPYTSRILPCAGRKQHRSWFGLGDRESLPNCHLFHLTAWPYRVHLYPRGCLCRCGGSLVISPVACVYCLDMSSFEYSRV